MMLPWLILIPLLGGFAAWPAARLHRRLPAILSFAALGVSLGVVVPLLGQSAPMALAEPGHWLAAYRLGWIPAFGMSFRLGLDSLSWLMVVLTLVLGMVAVLVSWRQEGAGTGFYFANLMWSLAGTVGVFLALDLFLFFYFWELMLVPMYFVIAIWGHEHRRRAAIKFFLFTQGSGLLILISIIVLAFLHQRQTGVLTFDYFALLGTADGGGLSFLVMLGLFLAFLVKLAGFPFHVWLPDTHTEAPTAGSVILASILLKTGAYGLFRFVVALLPQAAHEMAPVALWLGVASILYGAVLAYGQSDLKRLIAYTSISHMGFVLIGIFVFNPLAWQGVVFLLIAHGVSTGALFIVVGSIQHRLHTRDLGRMGGLWNDMPMLSSFGAFFVLAAMGLPGLGNFVGEFLILRGNFGVAPWVTVIAAIGLIPAALYSLLAIQRAFHGVAGAARVAADLGWRECGVMMALAVAVIWLGVRPQPVLDIAAPGLQNLAPAGETAGLAALPG